MLHEGVVRLVVEDGVVEHHDEKEQRGGGDERDLAKASGHESEGGRYWSS